MRDSGSLEPVGDRCDCCERRCIRRQCHLGRDNPCLSHDAHSNECADDSESRWHSPTNGTAILRGGGGSGQRARRRFGRQRQLRSGLRRQRGGGGGAAHGEGRVCNCDREQNHARRISRPSLVRVASRCSQSVRHPRSRRSRPSTQPAAIVSRRSPAARTRLQLSAARAPRNNAQLHSRRRRKGLDATLLSQAELPVAAALKCGVLQQGEAREDRALRRGREANAAPRVIHRREDHCWTRPTIAPHARAPCAAAVDDGGACLSTIVRSLR